VDIEDTIINIQGKVNARTGSIDYASTVAIKVPGNFSIDNYKAKVAKALGIQSPADVPVAHEGAAAYVMIGDVTPQTMQKMGLTPQTQTGTGSTLQGTGAGAGITNVGATTPRTIDGTFGAPSPAAPESPAATKATDVAEARNKSRLDSLEEKTADLDARSLEAAKNTLSNFEAELDFRMETQANDLKKAGVSEQRIKELQQPLVDKMASLKENIASREETETTSDQPTLAKAEETIPPKPAATKATDAAEARGGGADPLTAATLALSLGRTDDDGFKPSPMVPRQGLREGDSSKGEGISEAGASAEEADDEEEFKPEPGVPISSQQIVAQGDVILDALKTLSATGKVGAFDLHYTQGGIAVIAPVSKDNPIVTTPKGANVWALYVTPEGDMFFASQKPEEGMPAQLSKVDITRRGARIKSFDSSGHTFNKRNGLIVPELVTLATKRETKRMFKCFDQNEGIAEGQDIFTHRNLDGNVVGFSGNTEVTLRDKNGKIVTDVKGEPVTQEGFVVNVNNNERIMFIIYYK